MTIWDNAKHRQWADLARRTEVFVDKISNRRDIAVLISPTPDSQGFGSEEEIPAGWFIPSKAELHLHAKQIFDAEVVTNVENVDLSSPRSQKLNPVYTAVTVHEISHARHTTYKFPTHLPQLTAKILTALEEPRCEWGTLKEFPQYRKFLKSMMVEIVGKEFFDGTDLEINSDMGGRFRLAHLAILLYGRKFNGVLTEKDIERATDMGKTLFGNDFDALLQLIKQGIEISDDNVAALITVAEKIRKIIDPEGETDEMDSADGGQQRMPCGASVNDDGEGESGEGSPADGSEGTGNPQGSKKTNKAGQPNKTGEAYDEQKHGKHSFADLADSIADMVDEAQDNIKNDTSDQGKNQRGVNKKAAEEEHRRTISKAANNVANEKPSGSSSHYGYGSSRPNIYSLNPDAADRQRVRVLVNALRKAQFRGVTRSTINSPLPPGRLNMRQAMSRAAQVASRSEITATPWKNIRRREVDNPPITLAVATDISGSMGMWQKEVSRFTWAFAEAVKALQGKCGAVAWNGSPWELLSPSKAYKDIPVAETCGGSDGLPESINALDGMMNLTFGGGVRVLAVITDSDIPADDIQQKLDALVANGVSILWISTNSDLYFAPQKATVAIAQKVSDFSTIVGQKTIELLSKGK